MSIDSGVPSIGRAGGLEEGNMGAKRIRALLVATSSFRALCRKSMRVARAISASKENRRTISTMNSPDNILMALLLLQLIPHTHCLNSSCKLSSSSEQDGLYLPGDIMLGAVVPLHMDKVYQTITFNKRPPQTICSVFNFENYQHFQALSFAVEEINKNPNILPNVTLGLQAYDSCDVPHLDLAGSLQVLSGSDTAIPNYRCLSDVPLTAVIGAAVSTHSILLANILGLYRYPQISHLSTSRLLSDRKKFPSFFRTVPSDAFQSLGLAKLVLHFGWTWVGLLAMDNDYGQQGIQLVKQEIIKGGACVAFSENIALNHPDRNAPHIVKVIRESTAKVVVVFSIDVHLVPVLSEMLRQNVTDKIFVASEAWSTSKLHLMSQFAKLLSGTIGLALYSGTIPGFDMFLSKVHPSMILGGNWAKMFWQEAFGCTFLKDVNLTKFLGLPLKECTGLEDLQSIHNSFTDVSNFRTTYNIYMAVHIVARALEDLSKCFDALGSVPLTHCGDIHHFKPWQLLRYMKKIRVKLNGGREIYFDENGDPPAVYDIVNWQLDLKGTIQHVKVGSYDTSASPGQVFTINSSILLWDNENIQVPLSICSQDCPPGFWQAAQEGKPACCFECIPCSLGEISNDTGSFNCFKCPWDQWPNSEKSQCLPKDMEYLRYNDPLGTTLAVVSVLSSLTPDIILRLFIMRKSTPVVKANNYSLSCLLLLSLSLCFLCSLTFIGYPQSKNCLLRQAIFGMVFGLCISCILAKTIIVVIAFMATKPSSNLRKWTKPWVSYMIVFCGFMVQFLLCTIWLSLTPPFPQYNAETKPGLIIVECNEGSPIAFWIMLGYLFLLATISFIVAFLARKLPDSFNEAQFITFSMLAFLSVWISYIPASLSAQGKYTVAMEVFAILVSSWALVICMFFPKCFIIVFRPSLNTKGNIMRKDKG
ncbi:extracellular calcium-sensing receptor-like [Leptodactylus fuscus]|uniref:extracellular calcium-sensing receptor-like n=1 Tax=Leptodactylus fuscus TaxID=238119 RepID=UPI003F4ED741